MKAFLLTSSIAGLLISTATMYAQTPIHFGEITIAAAETAQEEQKPEISVCKGGTLKDADCICPVDTGRVKISRFEYVCEPSGENASNALIQTDQEEPKPEISVCINGELVDADCLCPDDTERMKISRFEYVCEAKENDVLKLPQ